MIRRRTLLTVSAGMLAAPAILRAQSVQKLTFYYPIAVGGPLQAIMDGYCKAFQQETGIAVEPVYAGDYSQTLIKALAAIRAGTGPQFAVLLAAEMHSLQDQDILVSLDEIGLDADGKKWLGGFYPAFMANSHADGKTWSVPFQRSTAIFYYNKAAFQDAGLDPEKFPTTWADACGRGGEADQARCVGSRDALGHQDGGRSRQCAVDVRRARQSGRAEVDERSRHRGLFQPAEDHRGDVVLAEPVGGAPCDTGRRVQLAAAFA